MKFDIIIYLILMRREIFFKKIKNKYVQFNDNDLNFIPLGRGSTVTFFGG